MSADWQALQIGLVRVLQQPLSNSDVNTSAKMAMTRRKGVGRESMDHHPFGLQDSWILIADYGASNYGNWIKSS
jgi:hypothetical protein